IRKPEASVHQYPLLLKLLRERLAQFFLARHLRQIRKRSQRLRSQPALVILRLHRQQRPAFHPAMPKPKILWQSSLVVRRFQKRIRFLQALPLFFRKSGVPALHDVIIHRDNVQRRRVSGSIRVWISLEPVHETRALGNLMRDLAILALEFADELQRRARIRKISRRIQRKRSPERIAPKKPRESWPLAFSRSAV